MCPMSNFFDIRFLTLMQWYVQPNVEMKMMRPYYSLQMRLFDVSLHFCGKPNVESFAHTSKLNSMWVLSVISVYDLFLPCLCFVRSLWQETSLYLPCIWVTYRNSCPNRAKCSCYLSPGGRATRHCVLSLIDVRVWWLSSDFLDKRNFSSSSIPYFHLSCCRCRISPFFNFNLSRFQDIKSKINSYESFNEPFAYRSTGSIELVPFRSAGVWPTQVTGSCSIQKPLPTVTRWGSYKQLP